MKDEVIVVGKVKNIFLITFLMSALIGCGNNSGTLETNETQEVEPVQIEEATAVLENTQEASFDRAEITYAGEEFQKSSFAAGANSLFICGIRVDQTFFLGGMEQEKDSFAEFPIEVPSDMRIANMYVDKQDKCHILWMSVEKQEMNNQLVDVGNYKQSYITILNNQGEIEKNIDVTGFFEVEQRRPFCFCVDDAGAYYFEVDDTIINLAEDGSLKRRISCPGLVVGIGIGQSGSIYFTYQDENSNSWMGIVKEGKGNSCEVSLPSDGASFSGLYAGVSTELLLYSKSYGVYAYDVDTNRMDSRLSASDLPVSGQDVGGFGIMGDGRLCLLSQKNGQTIFYYIPAETR